MILSCGEALIDMLPRTTTLGEPAFSPYAGGAVFNTAIALGRLGAPSAFFSGISSDMLGEILTETLEADLNEYIQGAGRKILKDDDKLDEALRRITRQVAMEEIGKKPEVTVVVSRLMAE